jgi:hypothetical protein
VRAGGQRKTEGVKALSLSNGCRAAWLHACTMAIAQPDKRSTQMFTRLF